MKKILVCGYRNWALNVFSYFEKNKQDWYFKLVETPEKLEKLALAESWDVIALLGWSWKVSKEICESRLVVGMHPSDLPKYSGGSPIQNQIIDGIEKTRATLFKLNEKFDMGEIIDKEPISLEGHLTDVFAELEKASVVLLKRFLEAYPKNTYTPQKYEERSTVKRIKPHQSQISNPLTRDGTREMTCRELWDFIRCREDPYPNAYFEDNTGKLVVKYVEFEPRTNEN